MRSHRRFSAVAAVLAVIMLTGTFAFAANDKKKPLEMQKPIEFPHAGISLAVPVNYMLQQINEPFSVMTAMLIERNEPKASVLLSAFPVDEKETAEAYAEGMFKMLKDNLGVTKLDLRKQMKTKVAGIDATVQLLRYTFHNSETHAARVFFVRTQANPAIRVCYMLEVQVTPGSKDLLVPTLGGVMKSVKMIPFQQPHMIPIVNGMGPVGNYRGKFCIWVPLGWRGIYDNKGNINGVAQTDYVKGESIFMMVSSIEVDSDQTPEKYARKSLEAAQQAVKDRGVSLELVSGENTQMGGLKAYQLLLRKKVEATKETPESVKIILQRVMCVPSSEFKKARVYTMHMEVPDTDTKLPLAMLEKLATGFAMLDDNGQPIKPNQPDATSRPADTQPDDKATTGPESRPDDKK